MGEEVLIWIKRERAGTHCAAARRPPSGLPPISPTWGEITRFRVAPVLLACWLSRARNISLDSVTLLC